MTIYHDIIKSLKSPIPKKERGSKSTSQQEHIWSNSALNEANSEAKRALHYKKLNPALSSELDLDVKVAKFFAKWRKNRSERILEGKK